MVLELKLKGPIGEGKSISASLIRGQLEAAAGSYNAIHFTISSKGGDFSEAIEIFTMLRAQPFPVAATAIGEVFSGALLVFMAAGLRKAKASAEFLIHPASRDRLQLPERLTAVVLQRQADELAKIDAREVDLFVDRTGGGREFFENEAMTEDTLGSGAAIQTGIVHEFEGLTPVCDPGWPGTAQRVLKENRNLFLPSYMTSQNYYEACRCAAAFFEDKKADVSNRNVDEDERVDAVPPSAPPRLTIIAG
jgi:ATP-dependent protease ClpP protease subunit